MIFVKQNQIDNSKRGRYMNTTILKQLFKELLEIVAIPDIGYHKFENGCLKPVYKTETDILGMEKWKAVHEQQPVSIKDTIVLREISQKKQPIEIYDTKNDARSAHEFFLFGVDSILIIPVVKMDEVKGIISIVSIGTLHSFTKAEIDVCWSLSKYYLKDVVV